MCEICETKSFYVLLAVLLITTTLLIAVSIYYYLLNICQKTHLLPYYVTNDKLVNDELINAL